MSQAQPNEFEQRALEWIDNKLCGFSPSVDVKRNEGVEAEFGHATWVRTEPSSELREAFVTNLKGCMTFEMNHSNPEHRVQMQLVVQLLINVMDLTFMATEMPKISTHLKATLAPDDWFIVNEYVNSRNKNCGFDPHGSVVHSYSDQPAMQCTVQVWKSAITACFVLIDLCEAMVGTTGAPIDMKEREDAHQTFTKSREFILSLIRLQTTSSSLMHNHDPNKTDLLKDQPAAPKKGLDKQVEQAERDFVKGSIYTPAQMLANNQSLKFVLEAIGSIIDVTVDENSDIVAKLVPITQTTWDSRAHEMFVTVSLMPAAAAYLRNSAPECKKTLIGKMFDSGNKASYKAVVVSWTTLMLRVMDIDHTAIKLACMDNPKAGKSHGYRSDIHHWKDMHGEVVFHPYPDVESPAYITTPQKKFVDWTNDKDSQAAHLSLLEQCSSMYALLMAQIICKKEQQMTSTSHTATSSVIRFLKLLFGTINKFPEVALYLQRRSLDVMKQEGGGTDARLSHLEKASCWGLCTIFPSAEMGVRMVGDGLRMPDAAFGTQWKPNYEDEQLGILSKLAVIGRPSVKPHRGNTNMVGPIIDGGQFHACPTICSRLSVNMFTTNSCDIFLMGCSATGRNFMLNESALLYELAKLFIHQTTNEVPAPVVQANNKRPRLSAARGTHERTNAPTDLAGGNLLKLLSPQLLKVTWDAVNDALGSPGQQGLLIHKDIFSGAWRACMKRAVELATNAISEKCGALAPFARMVSVLELSVCDMELDLYTWGRSIFYHLPNKNAKKAKKTNGSDTDDAGNSDMTLLSDGEATDLIDGFF